MQAIDRTRTPKIGRLLALCFGPLVADTSAWADNSLIYMIPSLVGIGSSVVQQQQSMALQKQQMEMQLEMQRRQMEYNRPLQTNAPSASAAEIAELKAMVQAQQKQIAELQRQLAASRDHQVRSDPK